KREVCEGVDFLWLRTPEYGGNGLGRMANMLVFAARTRVLLPRIIPVPPDVVIGSSPQPFAALAAERLAQRLHVPFVLEVRDLWPESLVDVGNFSSHHPLILVLRRIERHLYRKADHVICLLPGAEAFIRSRGARADRITLVPN